MLRKYAIYNLMQLDEAADIVKHAAIRGDYNYAIDCLKHRYDKYKDVYLEHVSGLLTFKSEPTMESLSHFHKSLFSYIEGSYTE